MHNVRHCGAAVTRRLSRPVATLMTSSPASAPSNGGVTRFFVEHRLLGWLAMVAVLVWGWFAFQCLPQQEDPTFPLHDATLITVWPQATAAQIEQEVTSRIEAALAQLPTSKGCSHSRGTTSPP